jgi:hypothetical protein
MSNFVHVTINGKAIATSDLAMKVKVNGIRDEWIPYSKMLSACTKQTGDMDCHGIMDAIKKARHDDKIEAPFIESVQIESWLADKKGLEIIE